MTLDVSDWTSSVTVTVPCEDPVISIVIPTIPGREDFYNRNLMAYKERTHVPFEVITAYAFRSVGLAWQAGAEATKGRYIALSCDDLEIQEGWDEPAMACCDAGQFPAPRVTNGTTGAEESRPVWGAFTQDGTDTGISVVPFMSREQYEKISPFFTAHYYTDDFISDRARANGWPSVQVNAYHFKHFWAQHGRGAGMTENERMVQDQQLYNQARQMVARGEWTKPWPEDGGRR
jgi:hypothetical protein